MTILKNIAAEKNLRLLIISLFLFAILILFGCSGGGNPDAEKAAVSDVLAWLDLIDNGSYDDSWEVTAEQFKKAGSKERWIEMLDAVRKPHGQLLSRKIQTARYKTRLPEASIGEYVVIKFDTNFENKKDAIETVITSWGKGGRWRVIGYTLE